MFSFFFSLIDPACDRAILHFSLARHQDPAIEFGEISIIAPNFAVEDRCNFSKAFHSIFLFGVAFYFVPYSTILASPYCSVNRILYYLINYFLFCINYNINNDLEIT